MQRPNAEEPSANRRPAELTTRGRAMVGEPEPAQIASREFAEECSRSYYRVDTRIPLRVSWLTKDETEVLIKELNTPKLIEATAADSALAAVLERIEWKLDLLLAKRADASNDSATQAGEHGGGANQANRAGSSLRGRRSIGEEDMRNVVLSGAGLHCETSEPFRPGDAVKVEMLVPGSPPLLVVALGHVVCGPPRRLADEKQIVAVSFALIDEGGRDAIVRHVCEVQRLILKSRSESSPVRSAERM